MRQSAKVFRTFFWKGRVALHAILKALGVGPGDQVILPAYTCVVVPAAAHFLGARPLYVDVEPETCNLSLERITDAWSHSLGNRIRAVVVQHTYGMPADVARIVEWARARNIAVVEDCCHVLGSRYQDLDGPWYEAGTLGDAAFFSSQWSKPISTGLGGWTRTTNPTLAEGIKEFCLRDCISPSRREVLLLQMQTMAWRALAWPRTYWAMLAAFRSLARAGICVGSSVESELLGEKPPGYAKSMSGFQARLLEHQLVRSPEIIRHRRRLQGVYERALRESGFPCWSIPEYADPVFLRYPVRVSNKRAVLQEAERRGIELGDWFDHPLHPKEANAQAFGYDIGTCPVAEKAASEVVNLPMHMRINERLAAETVRFLALVGQPSYARLRRETASPASPVMTTERMRQEAVT